MNLQVQINTLIFSFLYGIFFEITFHVTTPVIYHKINSIRYLGTFIFIILHVISYFLILQKINHGVVHVYSIFCLIIGYIASYNLKKYILSRFTFTHRE